MNQKYFWVINFLTDTMFSLILRKDKLGLPKTKKNFPIIICISHILILMMKISPSLVISRDDIIHNLIF